MVVKGRTGSTQKSPKLHPTGKKSKVADLFTGFGSTSASKSEGVFRLNFSNQTLIAYFPIPIPEFEKQTWKHEVLSSPDHLTPTDDSNDNIEPSQIPSPPSTTVTTAA
ncbi:hypothetical protein L2E82_39624 [Cichorium intybus]|uniref:Uncharacterized protein n=1 Tax=Cichorium intybus TaxID=13427 RepID=A0ACB9AK26_CICIN|nr:hypothetical protein L2E82_39624 [Cichorium intybus]